MNAPALRDAATDSNDITAVIKITAVTSDTIWALLHTSRKECTHHREADSYNCRGADTASYSGCPWRLATTALGKRKSLHKRVPSPDLDALSPASACTPHRREAHERHQRSTRRPQLRQSSFLRRIPNTTNVLLRPLPHCYVFKYFEVLALTRSLYLGSYQL